MKVLAVPAAAVAEDTDSLSLQESHDDSQLYDPQAITTASRRRAIGSVILSAWVDGIRSLQLSSLLGYTGDLLSLSDLGEVLRAIDRQHRNTSLDAIRRLELLELDRVVTEVVTGPPCKQIAVVLSDDPTESQNRLLNDARAGREVWTQSEWREVARHLREINKIFPTEDQAAGGKCRLDEKEFSEMVGSIRVCFAGRTRDGLVDQFFLSSCELHRFGMYYGMLCLRSRGGLTGFAEITSFDPL